MKKLIAVMAVFTLMVSVAVAQVPATENAKEVTTEQVATQQVSDATHGTNRAKHACCASKAEANNASKACHGEAKAMKTEKGCADKSSASSKKSCCAGKGMRAERARQEEGEE